MKKLKQIEKINKMKKMTENEWILNSTLQGECSKSEHPNLSLHKYYHLRWHLPEVETRKKEKCGPLSTKIMSSPPGTFQRSRPHTKKSAIHFPQFLLDRPGTCSKFRPAHHCPHFRSISKNVKKHIVDLVECTIHSPKLYEASSGT